MKYDAHIPDVCPHCGQRLSSWQQVLLSVDRSLMCKNCWYRIILDRLDEPERQDEEPPKEEDNEE